MKAFVTGSSGHLGSILANKLAQEGWDVYALIRGADNKVYSESKIVYVLGDIEYPETLENIFRDIDVVFHAASAISFAGTSYKQLFHTNVVGTQNVVSACIDQGVKKLIYVSSIEALNLLKKNGTVSEIDGFAPEKTIMPYGRTKALASLEVMRAVEQGKIEATIVCPTGFVGPYDPKSSPMGRMIADFLNRRLLASVDGGFNFIDVRDVAKAIISCIRHGGSGQAYILSGHYVRVQEFMALLEKISGIRRPFICLPLWLAQAGALVPQVYYRITGTPARFSKNSLAVLKTGKNIDGSKAQQELGFYPRPFEDTIKDTIHWLKSAAIRT